MKLFVSYSRKDQRWLERLKKILSAVDVDATIEVLDDSMISAGDTWLNCLQSQMDASQIGLLLISPDFLTSEFIQAEEFPRLIVRNAQGGIRLYPLLIRDCEWNTIPELRQIQMRPAGVQPLASLRGRTLNTCLTNVARELVQMASAGRSIRSTRPRLPTKITLDEMRSRFVNLEQLIAIFSLMSWRTDSQQPPLIKEDSECGGKMFTVEPKAPRRRGGETKPGELFTAFAEKVREYNRFDEKYYTVYRITPDEDYWYEFSWDSLFGYALNITISPSPLAYLSMYQLRDRIAKSLSEAESFGSGREEGHLSNIPLYVVRISGIPHSEEVLFIAAGGDVVANSDGSVNHSAEWMVYLSDGSGPISLRSIRKIIHIALNQFHCTGANLPEKVASFERLWTSAEPKDFSGVIDQLRRAPDMDVVANFVVSPSRNRGQATE